MTESTFGTAAYGGDAWSPRTAALRDELGTVWATCGIDSEWQTLRAVLLHRPGAELAPSGADPDAVQMLEAVDASRAGAEHDALAAAYRGCGVAVHYVAPAVAPPPNQMFCADLMFATPEGVILARPASTVRAGEERHVARRLADLGVPIVRSVSGRGTFEGADAMWLDAGTVVIGVGLRTNEAGAAQVAAALAAMNVEALIVDLPFGTMHLMGMLRMVADDLSVAWPRRTPHRLVNALRERGHRIGFLPDGGDLPMNRAMNFVTLGPRRILMKAGHDTYTRFFEDLGIECLTVPAAELVKAAGGFGCLTGVLQRDRMPAG